MRKVAIELWWRFFDWLAVVPWKTLVFVSIALIVIGGMLQAAIPFLVFVLASLIIKAVAGGKRRADLTATQAVERAESERLERAAAEAHLEALQAQIEPHFLFNTLASIDQLILTDAPRASRMQQSLIRYLRSAMPRMRDGERPTLGQQVELSHAYLEIMQIRMEDRLRAAFTVPEGLRTAIFPSMMLQTLVENAIKHGLEPKAEGGRVSITAEVAHGQLVVSVCDDGLGFSPKASGGVGLANIRERLKGIYRGRAELVITVPEGGGTCATITVPYEIAAASAPAA